MKITRPALPFRPVTIVLEEQYEIDVLFRSLQFANDFVASNGASSRGTGTTWRDGLLAGLEPFKTT